MDFRTYMNVALDEARAAGARGEVPVGAVVASPQGVIAQAGNRTREMNDPTAHAEVLAIRAACAALGQERLTGLDLYVTLEPCPMCAAAISNAGPSPATDVSALVTLPSGASVQSVSPSVSCVAGSDDVACLLPVIGAGETTRVLLEIVPTGTGSVSTDVLVSSAVDDPTSGNNTAIPRFCGARAPCLLAWGLSRRP